MGTHIHPQQKLVSKVRDGVKIIMECDTAKTPNAQVSTYREVKALTTRRLSTSTVR